MKMKLEKVFERDIDLLVINKFINDKNFVNIFLNKIHREDYDVINVEHSIMDENGESDVTVILEKDNYRIALLIEDKIDAVAMPSQRHRYDIRGNKGIVNNKYSEFFVFIVAPESYLESNAEARKYENQISYEFLRDFLQDDKYAYQILSQALEEKKAGYVIIENKNITNFWNQYYKYIKDNYPMIEFNEVSGPRGAKASWPHFRTPVKKVHIIHKSDRGYLDLSFGSMGEYYDIFMKYVADKLDDDMSVHKTNKSMAIRLHIPCIDFNMPFDEYSNEMKLIMDSAVRLLNLLSKINTNEMYKENK